MLLIYDSNFGLGDRLVKIQNSLPKIKVAYWLRYESDQALKFRRFVGWLPDYTSSHIAIAYKHKSREWLIISKPAKFANSYNNKELVTIKYGAVDTKWMVYYEDKTCSLIPMDISAKSINTHKANFIINEHLGRLIMERI